MLQSNKYFHAGQKVLLRSLNPPDGRFEALTVLFKDGGKGYFDLTLPYGGEEGEIFPFDAEMPFEILSNSMGMGVRLTGAFQTQLSPDTVRIYVNNDLQLYKKRINQRLDTRIGVRFTKGKGAMRSFRDQWEKNARLLADPDLAAQIPEFPQCPVNLSSGGIRFAVTTPIDISDLCLLLIDLGDGQGGPMSLLAEVVWMADQEQDGRKIAGFQFLDVLDADQERINKFVRTLSTQKEKEGQGA